MNCTLHGCHSPANAHYQNFCSPNHLKQYARRQVSPEFTNTPKGKRVFFYDRHHHEQNYEFSNFFPKSTYYHGVKYKTAEHAFQAQKFNYTPANSQTATKVNAIHQRILHADTPKKAAQIAGAKSKYLRNDWHQIQASGFTKKEEVMFAIVKDKFTRHPNLRTKLLKTGHVRLIEASPYDDLWGKGASGKGQNKLGRIMMKIRSDMQQGKY